MCRLQEELLYFGVWVVYEPSELLYFGFGWYMSPRSKRAQHLHTKSGFGLV